ncbi:MAG: hypothetical protein FWB93_00330 [Oscillospiraceae bacterium]|nr:hypothetical protein [Oscillospiraceae bacterium]
MNENNNNNKRPARASRNPGDVGQKKPAPQQENQRPTAEQSSQPSARPPAQRVQQQPNGNIGAPPPRRKRNRRKELAQTRIRKTVTITVMVIFALLIAVLLAFTVLGFSYSRHPVTDLATGERHTVTFFGRQNRDGQLLTGTLHMPNGLRGSVSLLTTGEQRIEFNDGSVFTGQIVDFQRTGEGRLELSNGDVFIGYFRNNQPNGRGRYIFLNGDVFEGYFLNGVPHCPPQHIGRLDCGCTYTWATAADDAPQSRFEGNFYNGYRHGMGRYFFENGSRYEGPFYRNRMHTRYYVNGEARENDGILYIFRGHNQETGEPIFDRYVGAFYNDVRTGWGIYMWGGSGAMFEGEFYNNRMHGSGTYTWPSGRTYTGYFEDGLIRRCGTPPGTSPPEAPPENDGEYTNDYAVEETE